MEENLNSPIKSFDVHRASRYIALGYPLADLLPLFEPLIRTVIKTRVVYDPRNFSEDDLMQLGRLKVSEIALKFDPRLGNLFTYSTTLISQALWAAVKLKPIDRLRVPDDPDPEQVIEDDSCAHAKMISQHEAADGDLSIPAEVLEHLRLEFPYYAEAAEYVFGVLAEDDYEQHRARVLRTLTHGFDVNPKNARFLLDHTLVILRHHYSRNVAEVRDDPWFDNKFKFTLVPELRNLLGERAFEKLVHYFGGVTISVPSRSQIEAIDRDLSILVGLAHDWNCGPSLARKFRISPEGIKAVYKSCLSKMHSDPEFRALVAQRVDLAKIPGFAAHPPKPRTKSSLDLGGKRLAKRKVGNTDSMGFTLGSRTSLLFTLIVNGKCTRDQLVSMVLEKFGGSLAAAKSTVGAFLSDVKQPIGRVNTSRGLRVVVNAQRQLSFTAESLAGAQKAVQAKRLQAAATA